MGQAEVKLRRDSVVRVLLPIAVAVGQLLQVVTGRPPEVSAVVAVFGLKLHPAGVVVFQHRRAVCPPLDGKVLHVGAPGVGGCFLPGPDQRGALGVHVVAAKGDVAVARLLPGPGQRRELVVLDVVRGEHLELRVIQQRDAQLVPWASPADESHDDLGAGVIKPGGLQLRMLLRHDPAPVAHRADVPEADDLRRRVQADDRRGPRQDASSMRPRLRHHQAPSTSPEAAASANVTQRSQSAAFRMVTGSGLAPVYTSGWARLFDRSKPE